MARLTVVRRYTDMNGRYVGELYLNGTMIGASLDNLPLDYVEGRLWLLDTWFDFLKPLTWRTVRVGGTEPANDREARLKVRRLLPFSIRLRIENRFVDDLQPVTGKGEVKC